jgi:hypothetical protein
MFSPAAGSTYEKKADFFLPAYRALKNRVSRCVALPEKDPDLISYKIMAGEIALSPALLIESLLKEQSEGGSSYEFDPEAYAKLASHTVRRADKSVSVCLRRAMRARFAPISTHTILHPRRASAGWPGPCHIRPRAHEPPML